MLLTERQQNNHPSEIDHPMANHNTYHLQRKRRSEVVKTTTIQSLSLLAVFVHHLHHLGTLTFQVVRCFLQNNTSPTPPSLKNSTSPPPHSLKNSTSPLPPPKNSPSPPPPSLKNSTSPLLPHLKIVLVPLPLTYKLY